MINTSIQTGTDAYHIEAYTPLRNSSLWTLQQNYFKTKGVTAWQGEVPFYISSNAFIATRYAQLVLDAIKDILTIHPELKAETFYIIELGAGLGKFSFYFLKAFFSLQDLKDPISICYIMTDVAEKNKTFWKENPYFQSLVNKGCLDFAILDVASDIKNTKFVFLEERNITLSELELKTPLMIIANYVFDCIQQDAFQIQNQEVNEIQFKIKSRYKNYNQSKSEHLRELQFEFLNQLNVAPYSDSILNTILQEYKIELLENSFFTMPLGAIAFLKHIASLTNNNYFLIVGDKGIAKSERWSGFKQKDLFSYDGCYAFMVNFDALGRYVKATGGDCLLTNNTNSFKICLYSSQYHFSNLPRVSGSFLHDMERFGADEFCSLNEAVQPHCYGLSLKALIAHLRLSCWDVEVYLDIHDRLIELVSNVSVSLSSDIVRDMQCVEDNIYYYPGMVNLYNQLGMFYQTIGQAEKAITLYKKALLIWGETMEPYHNLGMIYDAIGDRDLAISHYQKSLALNTSKTDDSYARHRLNVLSGRPFTDILKILARILFVCCLTAVVLYYLIFVL